MNSLGGDTRWPLGATLPVACRSANFPANNWVESRAEGFFILERNMRTEANYA